MSVGTYREEFGLKEGDGRIILAHGAKTITQLYSKQDIKIVGKKWSRVKLLKEGWGAWARRIDLDASKSSSPSYNGEPPSTEVGGQHDNGHRLLLLEKLREQGPPPGKEGLWSNWLQQGGLLLEDSE